VIDYSGEYRFWSNTEAVTVTTKRAGADTDIDIPIATSGDLAKTRGYYAGAALIGNETLWLIPNALLTAEPANADATIEIGDTVTDEGGTVYEVKSATLKSVGNSPTHWECLTVQQG
jgi:hypothetical protein